MKLCQTTADLQEEVALARAAGKSIGLIPKGSIITIFIGTSLLIGCVFL